MAVTGEVEQIKAGGPTPDMLTAVVRLDGDPESRRYEVAFYAALLDQWTPEAVRAWILQQAADAQVGVAVDRPAHPQAEQLLGKGAAALVTPTGEIGVSAEPGRPCPRSCKKKHAHTGATE